MFENLTSKQIAKAAQLKERIETLQAELDHLVGQGTSTPITAPSRPAGKRDMSAAGKTRIAAAQKARWAKFNEDKGSGGSAPETKPKRTMSPAAKAKIAAAARKRWKKAKAAGKNTL
ncbi:MAG: hypothetical protein JWM16_2540 [Verrucomicrobiales bacterium]|nr:hypothetical protein [Verrucomicrobiales bacterium]